MSPRLKERAVSAAGLALRWYLAAVFLLACWYKIVEPEAFALPIAECSSDDALAWLEERGFKKTASSPHSGTPMAEVDLTGNVAVIVGCEDKGLSRKWLDAADTTVSIPMLGQADSLNAAASATVLLYEAVRQRMTAEGT